MPFMSKIGVLLIATNHYVEFLPELLAGLDRFFMKNHDVTVFLHTNLDISPTERIKVIKIEHKAWPHMTLDRYDIFSNHAEAYKDMDYLYYIDADSRIIGEIGDEILAPLLAVIHFSYDVGVVNTQQTLEINPKTVAFVPIGSNYLYVCGGFQGGKREDFIAASEMLAKGIKMDLERGVMARFHDETHWAAYVNAHHFKTVKLPTHFACPEPIPDIYKGRTKIEFIRKDRDKFRKPLPVEFKG